jgi:hypothetical protein
MGTEVPVIELYEQLFFDVRSRMGASDWILKVILGPPSARSASQFAARYQSNTAHYKPGNTTGE